MMVYFARESRLLIMRLPICNQNMSMMIRFMGGQVRERETKNMVVIVPVSVFRMVSKFKEIQSLVRSKNLIHRGKDKRNPRKISF